MNKENEVISESYPIEQFMKDAVKYIPTNSSNVLGCAYHREKNALLVTFKNNSSYVYYGVLNTEFNDLVDAPSVGRFFLQNIKNKLFDKLETDRNPFLISEQDSLVEKSVDNIH